MSAKFSFSQLIEAVDGVKVFGDPKREISGVQTNSREVHPDCLFVARRGLVADGHKYLQDALDRGAAALIVDSIFLEQAKGDGSLQSFSNSMMVVVESSEKALLSLAAWWRQQISCPVIAITGSNGKTTTKEILSGLLSDLIGNGVASQGSYNNEVGVPLTILAADRDVKWLVLEMGMNHPGELIRLSGVGAPDAAVILNIAPAHIGNFEGVDQIADAKCEIVSGLKEEGILVVPSFDKVLQSALGRLEKKRRYTKLQFGTVRSTGQSAGEGEGLAVSLSDISSSGFKGIEFSLSRKGECQKMVLPLLGEHNAFNVAAAVTVICELFSISLKEVSESLLKAKGAKMRLEIQEFEEAIVVNDAYNANPRSVEAAFQTVDSFQAPLIIVLGDMGELGEKSEEFHQEVGRRAAQLSPTLLVVSGSFSKAILKGAEQVPGQGRRISIAVRGDSPEAISQEILSEIAIAPDRPVILVKGSRSAGLERVVDHLVVGLTNNS